MSLMPRTLQISPRSNSYNLVLYRAAIVNTASSRKGLSHLNEIISEDEGMFKNGKREYLVLKASISSAASCRPIIPLWITSAGAGGPARLASDSGVPKPPA